jgi:signal transduction histidine kinase/CheY-like chemotaxis protein
MSDTRIRTDNSLLLELRDRLDAAIESGTAEDYEKVASLLPGVLAEPAFGDTAASAPDSSCLQYALGLINNAWLKGSAPSSVPEGPEFGELSRLLGEILLVQSFALAVSRGDLSGSLKAKGFMAGSLKALQANLRHLTWQTQKVAEGDFSQQVEFMGEFSHAFNTMTARLAESREALREAHDQLERRVAERTEELKAAYDKLVQETKEREQLETQLRQAQKMETLGTLVGGIAHDFNNVLAAIIGFSEMAADKMSENPRVERHLQRIHEAGVRARELIKQMLAFSRKKEPERKPVRLSSIVTETTRLIRASIPTTISIKTLVASESGPILGDVVQIQQVLLNLCTNAAHAMPKGGVLDVTLADCTVSPDTPDPHGIGPGHYMKLDVRDTGTGISSDIIGRIFDPFFTTKKAGEGTGLGLSVVHGIVHQHGGYVTVESRPGEGTCFSVYFPRAVHAARNPAADEEHVPTGNERVLFVDDEEALAEMGQELLESLGYEVIAKTSSLEALALVQSDPARFDIVITDQTMPELTGAELAAKVMAVRPDLAVVLCTGFSRTIDNKSAREAGVKALVMKPLTKAEIARAIREALDGGNRR